MGYCYCGLLGYCYCGLLNGLLVERIAFAQNSWAVKGHSTSLAAAGIGCYAILGDSSISIQIYERELRSLTACCIEEGQKSQSPGFYLLAKALVV